MALTDYAPDVAWFADGVSDLDIPTGASVTNPIGALGTLTVAGSPDSYADCSDDAAHFGIDPTAYEVGTGDITVVIKARVTTFVAGEYLVYDYDGTGTTGTATGIAVKVITGGTRRVALVVPPSSEAAGSGLTLECSSSTLVAGQDFIIAFRRSSGTWTIWLDADASGGMVSDTPAFNNIGSSAITECEGPIFGAARNASATTALGAGRVYWYLVFSEALSDADLQLAAWDTESNLKTAWLSGGSSTTVTPTTGLAIMSGGQASVNPFSNVRIRDTLINEAGSPVGSRTGIHLMVWYAGVPSGAPDLSYSDMTSDANGTISWSIATGSLAYNQNIFYVAHDGNASGSLSQYTCARMIPSYE